MPTAIRCGTFIDGTGADPVRGATLVFEGNTITSIDPGGQVPPYALRKAREVLADHQASFRLAVERGVRVAMGTDTGVGPHGTNAEEIARSSTPVISP